MASAQQSPIEATNMAAYIGINDNSILRYEDEGGLNPDGRGKKSNQQSTQTPYMSRGALGFAAGALEAQSNATPIDMAFGDYVSRSIHGYERAQNLINSAWAPQGSSINQLS